MARPYRLFWLLILAFHVVAAAGALWLLPGGFPADHPRFWSNTVAPIVVLGVVGPAIAAAKRQRYDRLRTLLIALPIAWAAASLALRILFPITFRLIFCVPLAGAVAMAVAWMLTFRRRPASPDTEGIIWAVVVASALLGAVLPLSQRPPEPDTHPADGIMPATAFGRTSRPVNGGRLTPRLSVSPGDGSARVKAGALSVDIKPLLTFISRSPDGAPTILAPADLREGPGLRLQSSRMDDGHVTMWYQADYDASLLVEPGSEGGPIVLVSHARLTRPIFSHLNSYCDVEVSGHTRLSLSFSPCPEAEIDVLPTDYPTGRPLRLAYRDARDRFHVVEASSGEKGPFRELASGPLTRLDPLGITIRDRGKEVARITLDDWGSQTGTAPSPTAGWGVPVNAIEFSLSGDAPTSTAAIYFTLAGTSVGRGWDSVGHAEGTYQNRITVDILDPEPVK